MNMSKKSNRYLKFMDSLSNNTILSYRQAIQWYEKYHGTSIEVLIEEALDEQAEQVPPHRLTVISRLENFQDYLISQELVYGTIHLYMSKIKSIYRRNRVVLPYIEPLNSKQVRRREYIEFKDVLTKEELRKILPLMRLPARARAMAMIQGGLSNEECEHLTTRSFIDELKCYHQKDDDIDALNWLADEQHPVIWVTKLIRWKTKKPYYALLGAEAVNTIASAKLYELTLPSKGRITDKLLDSHKGGFNRMCVKINERLGLGKAGEENRLKPHNLRRFHATYIGGSALSYEEHNIISNSEIDEMQGRGKTATQDTYIKTNPIRQKVLYAKVMNNVSLFHKYEYEIIDNDVVLTIVDPMAENKILKERVKKLEDASKKRQMASEEVQKLRELYGDDTIMQMMSEILNAS